MTSRYASWSWLALISTAITSGSRFRSSRPVYRHAGFPWLVTMPAGMVVAMT